jgi:hypothetical protein
MAKADGKTHEKRKMAAKKQKFATPKASRLFLPLCGNFVSVHVRP